MPEFQVMSNRPGIGHAVVARLKAGHDRYPMIDPLQIVATRIQGKPFPLGRYLRDKFHELVGVTKQQKAELLRTLNGRKYAEIDGQGVTSYQRIRKARIAAAQGRRIERIKAL